MTKLEQKLKELGYRKTLPKAYEKEFKNPHAVIYDEKILLHITYIHNELEGHLSFNEAVLSIKKLNEIINELENDLEVLKQCQD